MNDYNRITTQTLKMIVANASFNAVCEENGWEYTDRSSELLDALKTVEQMRVSEKHV